MKQPARILIVDDQPSARATIEALLRHEGYQLAFAAGGAEALTLAVDLRPDLLLLDVMMPEIDGFEVCRLVRSDPRLAEMPVILLTALDDRDSRLQGIQAGADEFVSKPFDRLELRARVRTITELNRYKRLVAERAKFERLFELAVDGILIVDAAGLIRLGNAAAIRQLGATTAAEICDRPATVFVAPDQHETFLSTLHAVATGRQHEAHLETVLLRIQGEFFPAEVHAGHVDWDDVPSTQLLVRDVTERKRAEAAVRRANAELLDSYDRTIAGWVRFLDLRDHETEGHTQRVTEVTVRLGRVLGLGEAELVQVRRGALLHDIGKMGVPDAVLLKPGPLDPEEWEIMRRHPIYARQMLEPIAFLQPALDIPYAHHEHWDGRGYPHGLVGEQIPFAARIFAVVDVWDALSSNRPYRQAWPTDRVRAHIRSLAGSHFDPAIVDVFLTHIAPSPAPT
ncbi:MAG: response regulator [Chloroflexi bacterium]|nr:response regulator [Chloroflexota bacterium]